jgi:flagellar biogenesis protein FliO
LLLTDDIQAGNEQTIYGIFNILGLSMPDASIMNSSVIMALIVGVLILILMLVKKMFPSANKKGSPVSMQIVSKMTLQPRVNMYMVKVGQRTLLIGVAEKNISLLSDLSQQRTAGQNPKSSLAGIDSDLIGNFYEQPESPGQSQISPKQDASTDESLSIGAFLQSIFKKSRN